MSRNGSGTYVLPAGQPVTNGTVIDATVFNTLTTDLANALTTSLSSDGQTVPTSNLPMGGLKHTGVAASTALTDYARTDQAQNSSFQWLTSVTGSDTIAASANPIPSSYAAGQKFRFIAAGANTGAVTLNVNALGAKSVTKNGGTALSAGDISINSVVEVVYDGTQFQVGLGLGDVKKSDLQSQTVTAFTSSGSSPTFTVTTSPAYGALAAGQRMRVKFHAAGTTGSNTLNRDGLGAKNLMQYDSTGAKVSAVVASGQLVDVEYDGTDMVLLSPLPPTVILCGTLDKAATYTVVADDKGKVINCTTGSWSLNLTAAATLGDGFQFAVWNSGAGTITIDPNASETIDGATTKTIGAGKLELVYCNGTAFVTVGSGATGDVQTFNSSGTWTKPSAGTMALIEVWGAGGGGGNANRGGGGGGGGYARRTIPLSSLGSTETVTVASTTSVNATGGSSTFGAWLTAYGGAAGQASAGGYGGGGGGPAGAGSAGAAGAPSGFYGTGGVADTSNGTDGIEHGGGGGPGSYAGNGKNGGKSVYGGGGGAGAGSVNGAAGTSVFGGAGGVASGAGTQPGGGGGGGTGAGAGGAGRVVVTVW